MNALEQHRYQPDSRTDAMERSKRIWLWSILFLLAISPDGAGQGMLVSVVMKDSSARQGLICSVRDSGLVLHRARKSPSEPELEFLGFNMMARLCYVDRSQLFDPTTLILSSFLGATITAGISFGISVSDRSPTPGPLTYAIFGAIEGALLGGLLGWMIDDGPKGMIVLTEFPPVVKERLRGLSRFPSRPISRSHNGSCECGIAVPDHRESKGCSGK